ncbi:hypothetical protein EK21DRAFT_114020 [Setomelanomma holmii]|uniref:Uncharacterized protein n=1 Tax=Setomelanomma holmii TaxID=210430 RepID=A0A9P4LIP9_9PLEO|nr:hypothetical protein EK21DRAFT_114020 [Setomelanomma holmii]
MSRKLPLSFFTSYFGQNVSEIAGDANNPTSWQAGRTATPISAVVIVLALLIAYYITMPDSVSWFWQRPVRYAQRKIREHADKRRTEKERILREAGEHA